MYTSILTTNEYLIKYYNQYRKQADCEERIAAAFKEITDIAAIFAVSIKVNKEAARLMSVWGEHRKTKGETPRDRKFRWDAYHIATAHVLQADRVYAYDGPWNDFPKNEIPDIKDIIVPARVVLQQPVMPLLAPLEDGN